jgi:hypothetical protein
MSHDGRVRVYTFCAVVIPTVLLAAGGCSSKAGGNSQCEDDAAFCVRLSAECGAVSGTDACGAQRVVASCGRCPGATTCGTGSSANVCVPSSELSMYERESAACAALPLGSGTVYYFCDCDGPEAQAECVAGDDAAPGTSPDAPKKTLKAANALAHTLAAGDTIAFCKGGSFPSGGMALYGWASGGCTSANPCQIREYEPTTFVGTQMPILAHPRLADQRDPVGQYSTGTTYAKEDLIVDGDGRTTYVSLQDGNRGHEPPTQSNGYVNADWWGNWGGSLFDFNEAVGANLELLNLRVQGYGNGQVAFFYEGASDVTMCNLDIDSMDLAIYVEGGGSEVVSRINLRGSKITRSRTIGYLGAASDSEIAYNFWEANGSTNMFDHTLYVSAHNPVTDFRIIGNYIKGQYGPTCKGVALVTHGSITNYTVDGNIIEIDESAVTDGCYGIGVGAGGNEEPVFIRNGIFARNTIKNGGNLGFSVSNCTNCTIENNLIEADWCYGPSCSWSITGMVVPAEAARSANGDDVSSNITIRNNTLWFGPKVKGGANGIKVGIEGSGYVIANNLIAYSSDSASEGVDCFTYGLDLSAYDYIDHNDCYSAAAAKWETTQGSLENWKTYAHGPGFDTESMTVDPRLTAPPTDFTPGDGSPLLGAADVVQAPAQDLNGKTRDTNPDIGAVER